MTKEQLDLIISIDKVLSDVSIDFSYDVLEDTEFYQIIVDELIRKGIENYQIEWGSCKIAIIINESFVIKFGFDENSINYLDNEMNSKLAESFPEIYAKITLAYHSPITGRKFYTQPFVVTQSWNDFENNFIPSKKSERLYENNRVLRRFQFNSDWFSIMIDKLGLDYYKRFCKCVEENENEFYDMHEDNYGYFKDGTPAILDYA